MILNRRLPFATLDDVQEIDDCVEAYGDGLTFDIQNMTEICKRSPSGQCEYKKNDGFACCIHCGRESGI